MNKWLYYITQWTWGLPLNIFGAIVFVISFLINCIYKMFNKGKDLVFFNKYKLAVEIVIPWNFGGLELGMFFLRGRANESIRAHEYGHSIQNMWWGPLFIFVIGIPSACRYWWREFYMKFVYPKTRKRLPPYDSIWFEGQATKLGNKF